MPVALPGLPLSVDDDLPEEATWTTQRAQWIKKTDLSRQTRQRVAARVRTKGGAGSGNFGHAGRPGKIGGSAPGEGTPSGGNGQGEMGANGNGAAGLFDRTLADVPVPDRINKWGAMSVDERDRQADSARTVPAAQKTILASAGKRPVFSGDVRADIDTRLGQMRDLVHPEAHSRITRTVEDADALLEKIGVDPKVRHQLGMEMADALVSQEYEAMTRQLGDHGIHHIEGNITTALDILDKVPGEDSDSVKAAVYIANVFHDTGYLTEPSRVFLDEGHARWSEQHYNANMRPLVAKALGDNTANAISHMIVTHAGTDIDWESDPVASAVRVADNLALFHKEKLPPLFRYVKGNLDVLVKLNKGEMDASAARKVMLENIERSGHSDKVKEALRKGAMEVNERTGKFTLGMLGGRIGGVSWAEDHLKIALRENRSDTILNKLLDLGQKQLAKFAKSYNIDPEEFKKSLAFKIPKEGQGKTVLETVVLGEGQKEARSRRGGILYGRR